MPRSTRLPAFVLAAAAALVIATPARADQWASVAAVQCRGNAVMVRFGWTEDEPHFLYNPLPKAVAEAWMGPTFHTDGRCWLEDGTAIIVRSGREQAFAYGAGGGGPPLYFSLWLNGRKIVSRQVYAAGYAQTEPYLSHAFYTAGKLELCAYTRRFEGQSAAPATAGSFEEVQRAADALTLTCTTRSVHPATLRPDPKEAAAYRVWIGTITARGTARFCRRFIQPIERFRDPPYGEYFEIGSVSTPLREVLSFQPLHAEVPSTTDHGLHPLSGDESEGGIFRVMTVDFFNTGKPVTVVEVSGSTHYFDGDRFYVNDRIVGAAAIVALQQGKPTADWHAADGGMMTFGDRYRKISLLRLGGMTYLLARPTNRADNRPGAVLLRPTRAGLRTVCSFQMTNENF